MKKLVCALIVWLLVSGVAFADNFAVGVTGPTAGDPKTLIGANPYHTIQCWYDDADTSVTAITIDYQTSLDGDKWFTLVSYDFTAGDLLAKKAMFHAVNMPANRIRFNLTVFTGASGTDTFYAQELSGK